MSTVLFGVMCAIDALENMTAVLPESITLRQPVFDSLRSDVSTRSDYCVTMIREQRPHEDRMMIRGVEIRRGSRA